MQFPEKLDECFRYVDGMLYCTVNRWIRSLLLIQGMEYNAFLWHEGAGICIKQCGLIGNQNASDDQFFVRKPFIGSFTVRIVLCIFT